LTHSVTTPSALGTAAPVGETGAAACGGWVSSINVHGAPRVVAFGENAQRVTAAGVHLHKC